ncbi:MAG: AMP-binding protein [Pseudomonadota bacterium]|nr:MAG: AMP-binding protein [Pseudomonadota bacterium]
MGRWLLAQGVERVALLADNSVAWALWDLAALQAGVTLVPLPGFFSDRQIRHVLADAGIELLISDDPQRTRHLPGAGPPNEWVEGNGGGEAEVHACRFAHAAAGDATGGHRQGDLHLRYDRSAQGRSSQSADHGAGRRLAGGRHPGRSRRSSPRAVATGDVAGEHRRPLCTTAGGRMRGALQPGSRRCAGGQAG